MDHQSASAGALAPGDANRRTAVAASLGTAFFLIPLYPAFIGLTAAPVPGISLVPKPLAIALLVLAAVIAVCWAVLLVASPKRAMPTLLPVAAFPGAAALAALLGFDPRAGALFIGILLGGVLWHAAVLRFARDANVLATIWRAYVISGAVASLAAIVMVLTKTPAALYTIGHGRAIGTFVLPGELAGYLIVYVPIAYALTSTQPRQRVLAGTGLALASVAFVLTFSRAGWIGMAAALAALVLLQRRRRGARYAAAIMGVVIVAVGLLFNTHHDPSENFTRISIWQAAIAMIERFPFSGTGPFDFPRIYSVVRLPGGEPVAYHAHSLVLSIAAETGLVGVAALLFGWWRFLAELRARLRASGADGALATAIAAGLAGTWVQGAIDTSSIVIFGLWLPMMALALACAGDASSERGTPPLRTPPARTRGLLLPAALAAALCCLVVQLASGAVYAAAADPRSLPAHVPRFLGTRVYEAIERVAPRSFVETVLADDALSRADFSAAARHAGRLAPGPMRSEFEARIAAARGRPDEAIRLFLDAGDDEALQPFVTALARRGSLSEARNLERRIADRVRITGTRPNALADCEWRLARLSARLGHLEEATLHDQTAVELAPLNTKYLIDAGLLALQRHDPATAERRFARAGEIDPADADAVAGRGLAALQAREVARALQLAHRADAINARATLARRLERALERDAAHAR
ncbi:MAG TPA: O-antigen ligase family protein [Dongiaceae bacterium]|nr:O-antigen ligase family protein [Dongiaceae bacterium]